MYILGVDPGPTKSGYALIEVTHSMSTVLDTNLTNVQVHAHGTMEWDPLIDYVDELIGEVDLYAIAVEEIIPAHGANAVINKHLVGTCIGIGRLKQKAKDGRLTFQLLRRQSVIKRITGKGPCKTHRPSKGDMQNYLKNAIGLDKVLRPQHANDAACVAVALHAAPYPEPVKVKNVKAPRPQATT